jgi:ABC-type branched-subunit amino acid transport system permease subunit
LGGTRHFIGPVACAVAFGGLKKSLRNGQSGYMAFGSLLILVLVFPQGDRRRQYRAESARMKS